MNIMHRIKRNCWFIYVLLLCACTQEQPEQNVRTIPVNDFFKSPEQSSYSISPDGKSLSFLKFQNKKQVLFVSDLESGKSNQVTLTPEKSVSSYYWVSNEELIFYKEKEGPSIQSDIFIINKEGTKQRKLNTNSKSRLRVIKDQLIENKYLLVSSNKRDSTVFDVYRLNVRNGDMEMAAKNPGNITNWITDSKGKLRLATSSDGVNETLLYRDSEFKPFKPVITNNFKTKIQPISFSDWEPNMIYAISNVNRDKNALVKLNCNTGKESKVLFSSDTLNVVEAQYSKTNKVISFVTCETWKKEKYYLDSAAKRFYTQLDKLLPGTEYKVTDFDKTESIFVIRTFTDRTPGSYYLYIPGKKMLKKLSDFNPSIKEGEMCKMKPITFKSRDGQQIQGYLTLPLKTAALNLPVVVLPHNRPEGRNSWGYNAEVQFLANRGYAVFQVNYRGSTGYGKEFLAAGFKQWGSTIRNDINDGVAWLIKEKIADPKRIAIYGTGFGGFIALNSVYSSPGIYACAASNSGVINLFSYLKSVPPFLKANLQMLYEVVGDPVTDVDKMRQVSPIFHAEKITVPLFLSQNVKDPRINSGEVVQFVRELRKKNDHITYVEKDNGAFSEKSEETRQNLYLGLEQFLYLNLFKH
jgi:dipeptidyl aminopeptidase/acylaminoacyl peptidase